MTVDFIYNLLSDLLPGFLGNDLLLILAMLLPFFALFGFITIYGFGVIYAELKVSSFIQDKTGPMGQGYGFHAGKWGLLQPVADGLHLFFKEDIIPATADRPLFILAPFLIFIGMFVGIIAIPFGEAIIISDMNIGIFYILGIGSLAVIALILAGWSSNNKWALYGAMRSAAQIISYEIPAAMSIIAAIMMAETMSMNGMVEVQAGHIWGILPNWFIFDNPFATCAFVIFFISGLAECNRTPFDIPEAESEYSVKAPATNSDSASGISNGVRLHSAKPLIKKITNAQVAKGLSKINQLGNIPQMCPACTSTIPFMLMVSAIMIAAIIDMAAGIS
jgi:NADH-quinone oxidoreductase subunit H